MIYLTIFLTFFFIGMFSFGGGPGMMPLIEQQVVNTHHWMSSVELYEFFGIAESTPGPIAVNIATAIGYQQAGVFGSILATLGVVLPSFIIIILISMLFNKFIKNKYVKVILDGVVPVILGLIIVMVLKITCINIFGDFKAGGTYQFKLEPLIITITLLVIYILYNKIFKKKIPPILLIIISAALGIIIYL